MEDDPAKGVTTLSGLSSDPEAVVEAAKADPVRVIDGDVTVAYLVSAKHFEEMMERLDDAELAITCLQRADEKQYAIEVDPDRFLASREIEGK